MTAGGAAPTTPVTFGRPPTASSRWARGTAGGTIVRQAHRSAPGGGAIVRQLRGTPNRAPLQARRCRRGSPQRKLEPPARRVAELSGELDIDRLLDTIVLVTFEVMHVDRVSILLLEREHRRARPPRLAHAEWAMRGSSSTCRARSCRKSWRSASAVLTHNAAADSRFKGKSILHQSVRSAMCTPLMAERRRGARHALRRQPGDANSFSDEDLQFLVAFSGLAAVGIGNSRYAERLRREAIVRGQLRAVLRAERGRRDRPARRQAIPLGGERRR